MAGNYSAGWLPYAEGLYTQHDDLLYQCMYIILQRERQRLGILNPFASPFYPETERHKYMKHRENEKQNGKIYGDENKPTEVMAEDPVWKKVPTKNKKGQIYTKHTDEQPRSNNNRYEILSQDQDSEYDDNESASDQHEYTTNTISDNDSISTSNIPYKTRTREELVHENNTLRDENNEISTLLDKFNYQNKLYYIRLEEANKNVQRLTEDIKQLQGKNQELHQKIQELHQSAHLNTIEANKNLSHVEAEDTTNNETDGDEKSLDEVSKTENVTEDEHRLEKVTINESILNSDMEEVIVAESVSDEEMLDCEESVEPDESVKSTDQCDELEETSDDDFDYEEVSRLARLANEPIVPYYKDTSAEIKEAKEQLERISRELKLLRNDP